MSSCLLHGASRLHTRSEIFSSVLAQGVHTNSTRSMSDSPHQSSLHVCFHWLCCAMYLLHHSPSSSKSLFAAETQVFYFCRMPENGASTQLISAQSRYKKSDIETTLKQVQFHLMSVDSSPRKSGQGQEEEEEEEETIST